MCRIYGYLGHREVPIDTLNFVANRQVHGGPDGQYLQIGKNWALGNNRLAIQGLDGGVQPFSLNNIHVVYNGEIYNHKELRAFLSQRGYAFSDNCDGSVIAPLYEIYGEDFVTHLDGMYSIAIIDERSEPKLILVSDVSAVKSVYYYWDEPSDVIYFSSELTSLLSFPIPKKLRLEAVDEYLIGRSIWHGKTFYQKIYSLSPQSKLIKKFGSPPKVSTYESIISAEWCGSVGFEDAADYFHNLFETEVKNIIQADEAVCSVISGGLDSSYVTAIAAKYIPNLHCFNVAYEGSWPQDERSFAKEAAAHLSVTYNQVMIQEKVFPDILAKTISHIGQPNSAPHALSTYALFRAINQAGFKVAITGEGADECFGGYERFRKAMYSSDPGWLDNYFDVMSATTNNIRNSSYSDSYKSFLSVGKYHLLDAAKKTILSDELRLNSRLKSLLQFDQKERFDSYILRRVDHLSMANAVEVRVPFCQPRISSFAQSIPDEFLIKDNAVKRILYQAAKGKIPNSILMRPKQPFTLPITAMLKRGYVLFEILSDTLNSQSFTSRGIFNQKSVKTYLDRQTRDPNNNVADLLWSMMILELWLQNINSSLSL